MEYVASAYGEAVDHGDDGLGYAAYLALDVEDGEVGYAVGADVAAASFDVHVAAGAEGVGGHPFFVGLSGLAGRVGSGEYDDAYGGGVAAVA